MCVLLGVLLILKKRLNTESNPYVKRYLLIFFRFIYFLKNGKIRFKIKEFKFSLILPINKIL